ncbi:tRNA-guanine transglycosylase DpdA [Tumebacillus sp. DT12]|uniref:tRNA-guanine transglycosylase DpdA n=1 Tax=Tumebacillus lacus TaxID=2995335 RepID=A0ABT3X0W5_9BACL|nr:tRNA-guanine transglycosylase DpdA [Tumebacillus lacus]MCX7570538.1 tRNA-guanine transglycosylase DpdA [Tumebacillus lacus]
MPDLKYFISENNDRVDPGFNFLTDQTTPKRRPLHHDNYAHEIFNTPTYDGLLISASSLKSPSKQKLIRQFGLRNMLRLPDHVQLMGDCGAYRNADHKAYTPDEAIEFYQSLEFDYGLSVEMSNYELTLSRAQEFIQKHKQNHCTFTPVGVAGGVEIESCRYEVAALIQMGYRAVSLGGLSRTPDQKLIEILQSITPLIPDTDFQLHLSGVLRDASFMKHLHTLGVTSFDSASPLRRAFMDKRKNYFMDNGNTYTAIRIPEAQENKGRIKQALAENGGSLDTYKQLETEALTAIRAFDAGEKDIDSTLDAILAYDQHLGEERNQNRNAYRRTLEDRPWKDCKCNICTEIGIDVIIFRGNNRNRRRGFHNTYIYYQQLHEESNPTTEPPFDEDEQYFPEGRAQYKIHRSYERSQSLIKKAKQIAKQQDPLLRCQVCLFSFYERYGDIGIDYIEAHHIKPLSEMQGEKESKVEDLALVCSNCHRMLHRKRPWIKVETLKDILKKT